MCNLIVRQIIEAFEISQLNTRIAIVEFSRYAWKTVGLGEYGSKNRLLCAVDKFDYKSKLYLRKKTCSSCLHSLVKTLANVWENSRADQWKPENWASEFSQTLPRFSPGYEGTYNMFYFFYEINIFRPNKEKEDDMIIW